MTRVDALAAGEERLDRKLPPVRAWALMLFGLASTAIGALGQFAMARFGDEAQRPTGYPVYAFLFLAFAASGALIAARRPTNAVRVAAV